MKNKNLILLLLVGYGIYWYMKNKKTNTDTGKASEDTSNNMQNINDQGLNVKFTIGALRKFGNVPNTI